MEQLIFINLLFSVIIVFFQRRNPRSVWTWLFALNFIAVFGILFYLLFGQDLKKSRMFRIKEISDRLNFPIKSQEEIIGADNMPEEMMDPISRDFRSLILYNLETSGAVLTACNRIQIYTDGQEKFAALRDALRKAEKYIHIQYYIIKNDEVFDSLVPILQDKARQGVEVRILYDGMGGRFMPSRRWEELKKDGIRVGVFFPPFLGWLNLRVNYRNHRKIAVIDGRVGFVGGFNIGREYISRDPRFGYWRDTGVRLRGPAAWSFTTMFLEFWAANRPKTDERAVPRPVFPAGERAGDCLVQPFCDSPVDDECIAKNVYLELINQAERELLITTPYLIADSDLITALKLAAKRGVDVRIYTPGIPDKPTVYQLTRSYFATLIRAGIKIFTFTPGFLHSKTWLCDGRIGAVGSINLDYRSLYLHFECSTLLYGGQVLEEIRADMMDLESQCREVALRDCRTSWLGTLVSAALRLVAPLC